MHAAVALPPCGRPGVTSGAPTCGGLCVVRGLVCGVIIRHVRRGDIHVARVAAVKCRPRGLVVCDKRGINVGATFMSPGWRAHACGWLRCLPAVGRASQVAPLRVGGLCGGSGGGGGSGVTSGAPTCGRFVRRVCGGSGGVVCVVCGQSWLRLIFPLMRKRATMWALGMTMSPA